MYVRRFESMRVSSLGVYCWQQLLRQFAVLKISIGESVTPVTFMAFQLKGRVHGLEHAHEFKCCFIACARCSEYANSIISKHC